jgi:type IV pilus assembly protein PilB
MANAASVRLSSLAQRLISDGLLSEQEAENAQLAAKEADLAFVSYLVKNKIISSQHIATIASEEFGVPLFDIETMNIELSATKLISEKLIRQHNAYLIKHHTMP